MYRLLNRIAALLLLITLAGCGGFNIPFIGSDDDDADDVATSTNGSSAIAKEDMVIQKFGPAQGSGATTMTDEVLPGSPSGSASQALAAAPSAQAIDPAPSFGTSQTLLAPPASAPAPASEPAPAAPAAPAAPPPAAASTPASRPPADNKTASNTPPPSAGTLPAKPGCDAFAKICAQVVDDFEFRYRAAEVQEGVYGVVGYVAPRKEELKGKTLDMTVMFAIVKGEGKANMPVPVTGTMTEPLRFERLFNVDDKPDFVFVESYTGKID